MKANTIVLPEDFDPRNPAPLFALLPNDGEDEFQTWKEDQPLQPPADMPEPAELAIGPLILLLEFGYDLTPEVDTAAFTIGPLVAATEETIGDPSPPETVVDTAELFTGPICEPLEIPLASVVYSQTSLSSDCTAATAATMRDGEIAGTATSTESDYPSWLRMDLGAIYPVREVCIGTGNPGLGGGWYTYEDSQGAALEYSTNGTSWTTAFSNLSAKLTGTGTFGIAVNWNARYIRLKHNFYKIVATEFYALTDGQVNMIPYLVGTQPVASYSDDGGTSALVNGTAAPVLGSGQVDPATAAAAGWTKLYDDTSDELSIELPAFLFPVTINGAAYDSGWVNSNAWITFGGHYETYSNISESVPAFAKVHFGAGDWSFQRVYVKSAENVYRVRWEGNSSYSASAGSSNRFIEIAFYPPVSGWVQRIEVRSGDIDGATDGPLMVATASTALASGTFSANESWVFESNQGGTSWTVQAGKHVTP